MDGCFSWWALLMVLAVMTVLGHAIWLLGAALLRALVGSQSPEPRRSALDFPIKCVRCQRELHREQRYCPECHLDHESGVSVQYRQLDVAADQIARLVRHDLLNAELAAPVQASIDRVKSQLLDNLGGRLAWQEPPSVPEMLAACADVRLLSAADRQRALAWYREQDESSWADKPSALLLKLARIVRMAGLESRALRLYELLVLESRDPKFSRAAEAAVEGAELADRLGDPAKTRDFVERALQLPLTVKQQRQIDELRPIEEESAVPETLADIPMVHPAPAVLADIPMARAAPVARPQAPRVPVEDVLEVLPEPPPPRRGFGEMLAGFMEERNILWGELVGGLLIVGCSIALVISLRKALEDLPYFPFVIIAAVTAALIGAGRYTLSHWKLESTSRGLLVIGTMLVPLSFMVLAGLSSGRTGDVWELATEIAAVGFFTWLVRGAAGILIGRPVGSAARGAAWLTTASIMGCSAGQLLVPHIDAIPSLPAGMLGVVGYVPAAFFVLTHAIFLAGIYRQDRLAGRQAGGLFLSLGLSLYAVVIAFGFVLYRADIGLALEYLAVPVALAGLPLLLGGNIASEKLAPDVEGEASGLPRGVAGVIATMLALLGNTLLLAALGAAWPHPIRLTAIGLVNGGVLALVAYRFRLAAGFVPALLCLAVACLTGFHLAAGHLDVATELGRHLWMQWWSPSSGVVFLILAALAATAAEGIARRQRLAESFTLVCGSGVFAVLSLALVAAGPATSPGRAALVFGACAAGALAVNLRWRQIWLTYLAAAVLFGATALGREWFAPELVIAEALVWTLLLYAALVLALAGALERVRHEGLRELFVRPLEWAAFLASLVAGPILLVPVSWEWLGSATLAAAALALIWLVLAWRGRQPALFAAFQGALAVAVVFAAGLWLKEQVWFDPFLPSLARDVRSWQISGIALAMLVSVWTVARFALRRSPRAWELLEPGFPAVDRCLMIGLVGLQLVVSAAGILPGLAAEWTVLRAGQLAPAAVDLHVIPLGWGWLAILAGSLLLTLRQGWAAVAVPALAVVGANAAVVAAAAWWPDFAVASALRWTLAGTFLLLSALVWLRHPLAASARASGVTWIDGVPIAALVRGILIACLVIPLLILTLPSVLVNFAGLHQVGPLEGSLFSEMGVVLAHLVPLALLGIGLVGHAVRDRSAGYAFSAGLVALGTVTGGYALAVITSGRDFGAGEEMLCGQLATLVSAAWLLGWLTLAKGSAARPAREPLGLPCRATQWVQVGLIAATLILWLGSATLFLAFPHPTATTPAPIATLKAAAGSWVGWLAVWSALAAAAVLVRQKSRALPSSLVGIAGTLLICTFACNISAVRPEWDHRALTLGFAALSIGLALTLLRHRTANTWPGLAVSRDGRIELLWIGGAGAVAVLLALFEAVPMGQPLWAAFGIAGVAATGMIVAERRRDERWLFGGGLLALLAASLVVWHVHADQPFEDWAILWLQVCLTTAAAIGLVWQFAAGQFSVDPHRDAIGHPWLVTQQVGIALGNVGLAVLGLIAVLGNPSQPAAELVGQLGNSPGWLALATGAAGLLCFTQRFARRSLIHTLVSIALVGGILASCAANRWDAGQAWTAFHVLTLAWTLVAAGVLLAGWRPDLLRKAVPSWTTTFPMSSTVGWISGIATAVVALAVAYGGWDPLRPLWPCGILLAVSLLAAAVTLWTRQGGFVYSSGLLFNVAGFLLWLDGLQTAPDVAVERTAFRLIWIQALGFAAGSLVWSLLDIGSRVAGRPLELAGDRVPYRHVACWAAWGTIVGAAALAVGGYLLLNMGDNNDPLPWLAWTAAVAAAAVTLWDLPRARLAMPWPQLYGLGLAAVGLSLNAVDLEPARWWWTASAACSFYVVAAALLAVYCLRNPGLGEELHMPARPAGWPLGWLVPVQVAVGVVVTLLGLWMVLGFELLEDRLCGALAVGGLLIAGVALTPHWSRLVHGAKWAADNQPSRLPYACNLLLGALVVSLLHCALVSPDNPAPWLHRTVLVMAAIIWCSIGFGLALPYWLSRHNPWAQVGRRMATPLGAAACALLALVMMQEFFLYDRVLKTTPLGVPAVALVAAALAVLIGGSLTLALSPRHDILRWSERGRSLYVYAAEVLIVLLFIHLRLNIPQLNLGRFGHLWPFVVMAIAFGGVGLSELFQRRGLKVLAGPLQRTAMLLPLLPILAFLLQPWGAMRRAADDAAAGVTPFTRFIEGLPSDYRFHAAIWFLMAALYLLVALSRRSSNLALGAALVGNFGLWVLLAHSEDLLIRAHPQLWLIPIGIIVLVAEHVNRKWLEPSQSLALRYAGLLLIYLSSTADMFIDGLGQNPIMPVVLAALAVAGVLLGILLRVRAFMLVGLTFLFLVVFSQIWHAAVDRAQTWVWWASGIVLGVAILTLFALFEKRRNDVLKVIEDIKRWH